MNAPPTTGGEVRPLKFHDFLVEFAPGYLDRFGPSMPLRQRQVLQSILRCRTQALGGQLFRCPKCGDFHYQYHSCNDRHCPRCGQADADDWLARQKQRLLLPISYFLVTFTLPEPFRSWIRSHLAIGLDLLFAASSGALQDLAANPKRLGAQLGMLGVLHTWARNLIFHPHIHYLVPAGGLSHDSRSWIPVNPNFLFDVEVLGAHFRTLFKQALLKKHPQLFKTISPEVWQQNWVVHCQPAGSGENALGYLSRYIFKTATGNRTLQLLPSGKVRWPYRDSNSGQWTSLDLEAHQLIARFLQHVLPPGYCRVRTFGWLHPAAKLRGNRVRALLRERPILSEAELNAWQPPICEEEEDAPEPPQMGPSTASALPTIPVCARCQTTMVLVARWKAGQAPPLALQCRPP